MSHITLIRHGQANSAARDEESYDKLSPLGHQQARWLGDYLRDAAAHHPRVYCGTLVRHVETAASAGFDDVTRDPRLNEIPYFTLATLLQDQRGLQIPTDREGFVLHLPQVFMAWAMGEIEEVPISFDDYIDGVTTALAEIGGGSGPALVVTSGGLISMVMRGTLGLDMPATARMALAIMNTSMHRIFPIGETMTPVLFNAVPHLEAPDRHHAQTHL
ncbi:histidine phosphatase family protein [Marinibacterium profundimaris]|uniref:Phosphoglycerate mutase n=1 Tax=Marinibacterium profundimaris TaxID=1679460 RepID=A0A225NNL0_9RHOB|nr:histidine phosphatase family protein [Marinibacterium profundimaris]OWU76094.1 phosphoglycerate mutase [Marinibacterium profundimaris]